MKKFFLIILALGGYLLSYSQHNLKLIIKDAVSKEVLAGATVLVNASKQLVTSTAAGYVQLDNIPSGKQKFTVTYSGYEQKIIIFQFPLSNPVDTSVLFLTVAHGELNEVVIQSTRTSRTIANTPTRVEIIDAEELDEKNNMRPANVSMLLHESTGLQVQQTSATSANASIRVQGLDGRYTQLLKDGYPNFGNFASGLSVLEIPPLDLKQVEVIKGPASTLYGGGAIAGVVNFISRTPAEKPDYNLLVNHSNVGQTNFAAYAAQKNRKVGYTILAAVNFQKAYDVDHDEFSELPKTNNFTISPRIFYYPDNNSTFTLGNSFTKGSIKGGDMQVINGHANTDHVYFENNESMRNITNMEFEKKYKSGNIFKAKSGLSFFDRTIAIPGHEFSGISSNAVSDLSYSFVQKTNTLITGANILYDRFREKASAKNQNTKNSSLAVYAQDTWDISQSLKLEGGLRIDQVNYRNINYNKAQTFILPRISLLFKINSKMVSRITGGLGYKVPTIFTEQTEAMQYRNILPLNNVTAEKSTGGTADLNYKTHVGPGISLSVNQLFFYTSITRPLILEKDSAGNFFFVNAIAPVQSKGMELNIKMIFRQSLKLFIGYTFTDAKATYLTSNRQLPLLPKHKLNTALVFEKEDNFKIGLEAYLTGNQYLYNGSKTPSYWEFGIMGQKTFKILTVFLNFENLTDERQSKYKTVVNPPHTNPGFDDIWNHTEGFVMNGGIKIRL